MGLGLCLSHQVIDCHKGSIRIESRVGEGTEVIVRFPFSRGGIKKSKNFKMRGIQRGWRES